MKVLDYYESVLVLVPGFCPSDLRRHAMHKLLAQQNASEWASFGSFIDARETVPCASFRIHQRS